MARVYVAVGSNLEPQRHVTTALAELGDRYGPLVVSTIYRNPAVDFQGPDFLNLVVGFDTDLDVHALVTGLKALEHEHGGTAARFTPRTLDLDLLLYDDRVLDEGGLRIPRKDITRYAFMLRPLAEIAGRRRHPVLGLSFAELWQRFDKTGLELTPVTIEPVRGDGQL